MRRDERRSDLGRSARRIQLLFACLLLTLGSATPSAAQTGEQGTVCVRDDAPGTTCQASDVEVTALTLVEVVEPCSPGEPGTARVILDVVMTAATDRYDVSAYLALGGGSALVDSECYHDYLAPPLTTEPSYGDANANAVPDLRNGPWANLEPFDFIDDCGDLPGGTEAILTLASESVPLQIACVDSNDDGNVDVDVCVAWRNGTNDHCTGLSTAVANNGSHCNCSRLEVTGLPEPRQSLAFGAGAVLVAGLARRRRRRRLPRHSRRDSRSRFSRAAS